MIDVSILVLAKNEAGKIGKCLDGIYRQTCDAKVEVILVDSGSTDGTLEIARRYPLKLYEIPPESFHHARTRNYAAGLAIGKYLVYLAGDAFPASEQWLSALIANFSNPAVAAVYGRHLPQPGCTFERQVVLASTYGGQKIVKDISRKQELGYRCYHFSTVNAAIRRDIWKNNPFPEESRVYEDVALAVKLLNAGWSIVYEPEAPVYHSHNLDAKSLFRRYFDIGVVYKRLQIWENGGSSSMFREGVRLLRKKASSGGPKGGVAVSIYYDAAKYIALCLGRNERFLPLPVKRRLSAFRLFD